MKHARHSRREFINVTGAALAGIAGARSLLAGSPFDRANGAEHATQAAAPIVTAGGQDSDLIVVNAKVYTMEARGPRAEA